MNKTMTIVEVSNGFVIGTGEHDSVAKTLDEVCDLVRAHFQPVANENPAQPQPLKSEAPEEQEDTSADTSDTDAENVPVAETSGQDASEWTWDSGIPTMPEEEEV